MLAFFVSLLLSLPVLFASGYLFLLAALARKPKSAPTPLGPAPSIRFDIVVPAHDEEPVIAETIASLKAVDYPADLYRIIVVADNCADATASKAEEAGAFVLTRTDPERKAKGYALQFAFDWLKKEGLPDVVVVVDADTVVSTNILVELAKKFENGAAAVQVAYLVRNAEAAWCTRLVALSFILMHVLRSLARERLGVSVGLRGDGMAFSREVIRNVPYHAFSTAEDVEHGIKLGEYGYRVEYVGNAYVESEMIAAEGPSRSQRQRWERGRAGLALEHGPKLITAAFRKRDKILLDLAMDLLIPPLSTLTLLIAAGSLVSLVTGFFVGHPLAVASPWLIAAAFVSLYVARGLQLWGAGLRGVIDLLWVPVYVVWKIGLWLKPPREPIGVGGKRARLKAFHEQ